MNERIFSIAHYIDQGVLYLLLTLCFFSLIMIFERYNFLKKKIQHSKQRQEQLSQILTSHDYRKLEELISHQDELEDRAINLSLEHFKKFKKSGVEEIFRYIENTERPKYERYLSFLATVGSNGPYIGLFGTVLGIMKAFNDMGSDSAGGSAIMAGISSALIATAAGLLVAIPSVLAFNFFSKQVKKIFGNLESCKELLFLYEKNIQGEQ